MVVSVTLNGSLEAIDQQLVDGVLAKEMRALAKTITLIESTRSDHQARARQVLNRLLPYTGKAIRIGITGSPGAGKSTFIEAFGNWLIDNHYKVAVLAIDPSSSVSGGSILGDKTRMESLCIRKESFIRPSPSGSSLGGVADKTREAVLVCEAAGYDVVIVETVGVGQSETAVAGMVDIFTLLQLPNAGDELQAIKKGVVEIADLIAINKMDIDPTAAKLTQNQWKQALSMLRPTSPNWRPPVVAVSALRKQGIAEFWVEIERFRKIMMDSGELDEKRKKQSISWMWSMIESGLRTLFREHPKVSAALPDISQQVESGQMSPGAAAQLLLSHLGN